LKLLSNTEEDPMESIMELREEVVRSQNGASDRGGKYLIFQIDREEFGIQVLKVREITGVKDVTALPQTPSYVKGVIDLRGKVIPVVDLRLKFGLPEQTYTERTCIIVVRLRRGAEHLLMGIVVDGVDEVVTLTEGDIEEAPDFGDGTPAPHILGMAKVKGKVRILLDIDLVLAGTNLQTPTTHSLTKVQAGTEGSSGI
jgi:purine-binding chemotaxis protein CheW